MNSNGRVEILIYFYIILQQALWLKFQYFTITTCLIHNQVKIVLFWFFLSSFSVTRLSAKEKSSPSPIRATHSRRTHSVQDPIFSATTKLAHCLTVKVFAGMSNICGVQTQPNLFFLKPQATYDPHLKEARFQC